MAEDVLEHLFCMQGTKKIIFLYEMFHADLRSFDSMLKIISLIRYTCISDEVTKELVSVPTPNAREKCKRQRSLEMTVKTDLLWQRSLEMTVKQMPRGIVDVTH